MPALGFRPLFAPLILTGQKPQTIRADRKDGRPHAEPGQKLSLFIGMRTKSCQLVLRSFCLRVVPVVLRWRPIIDIEVDGERLPTSQYLKFAQRDGFDDFRSMEAFWRLNHKNVDVFRGSLIEWKAPAEPVVMGTDLTMQGAE